MLNEMTDSKYTEWYTYDGDDVVADYSTGDYIFYDASAPE
jgi:hypothetical protein